MISEIIKGFITGFCVGAINTIIMWIIILKFIKDKKNENGVSDF
jgi:hypothetical protein